MWTVVEASIATAADGNFAASCSNIYVRGTKLKTQCRQLDGRWSCNSIDLNYFVANDDGQLVRRSDGNFAASCQEIWVSPNGVLEATCWTRAQTWRHTSLDLNYFIANYDGELTVF